MEFIMFALEGPGISWLNLWLCVCVCVCVFQVNYNWLVEWAWVDIIWREDFCIV